MKQIWSGGNPTQRVLGVLSLLVVAVGIGGGVWFAARPDHALLFGGLDPVDAASIVEEVRKAGVTAEARGNGTAVYVPSDRVDEMRMIVAKAGLPKQSSQGWSLFDDAGFGVSDFVQNVNFQRALEGELEQAIGRLDGVESATVQVTKAKRSAFISDERPAKASVILTLRAGRALSPENVRAVTHLVAGGVEGLDPNNVSILDNRGRLLSEPGESRLALNASNQVSYQRDVEDYLRGEAERLLAHAGIAATVGVNLRMDFQHVKSTAEKFEPKGVVTSETTESSTTEGGTSPSGGATAASGATQPEKGPASAKEQIEGPTPSLVAESNSESKETSKAEYKVGRTVTSEENATPRIEKMTVSLVLHEQFKDNLPAVEGIVKSAVGFDDSRGDVFSSMVSAFDIAVPVVEESPAAPLWPALVERGIQILGVLGALVLLLKLVKALESKPSSGAALGVGMPGLNAPQRGGVGEDGTPESLPEFVRETLKSDPTAATRVLQSWLRDGERN
jgi:flagellar M-ring protein FliF